MNKKIKLSLLSVLFLGSTLAVTLPIISCSGSTTTTLDVVKNDTNANLTAIGSAIAKVGNSNANTNTTTMSTSQFTRALAATYNDEVKTTIDNYFTFKNGQTVLTNVIDSIVITGFYPQKSTDDINVKIDINLKDGYIANSNDLTLNVKIGVSQIYLGISKGNDSQLRAMGTAIAKIGNPLANNNTGNLTIIQFIRALSADYSGNVKTTIDNYFTFKKGNTIISSGDVIESIKVSGRYPDFPAETLVSVILTLKPSYISSDNTFVTLQIGTRV